MILQIPFYSCFYIFFGLSPHFCPSDYLPMLFLPAEPPPPGTALNHPGKFGHPGSDPGDLLGKLHRPGKDLRHPFGRQHCFPGSRGALRREDAWLIADTNSKSGVMVNGTKIDKPTPVYIGDTVAVGSTVLVMQKADRARKARASWFFDGREQKTSASPVTLLFFDLSASFILALQLCFAGEGFSPAPFLPYALMTGAAWVFFPGFPAGVSPRQL